MSRSDSAPEEAADLPINYGPLPDLVGYQLRRAYSYLHRTFIATLKHLKLAPGQYSALVLISLNPGMGQVELARAAGLDASTIVPITNRFVELGWIRRVRRKNDRRLYALRIAPAGQAVLDKARPLIAAREKHLATLLDARERQALVAMLSQINDQFKAPGGVPETGATRK